MTTYFDRISSAIDDTRRLPEFAMTDALETIETRMVFDATIAAELPGFPDDLRDAIHRVVLRYGVATLPVNAPPADVEHDNEYAQRLADMGSDLHDIFHAYARTSPECSDSPRSRLQMYYAQGEERREALVAQGHA